MEEISKLVDSYELSYTKGGLYKRIWDVDKITYELKFKDPRGNIAIVFGTTYQEMVDNLKDYLQGLYT